jgi:hypothetical protein
VSGLRWFKVAFKRYVLNLGFGAKTCHLKACFNLSASSQLGALV